MFGAFLLFGILATAVNIPLFAGLTTKRVGFVLLLLASAVVVVGRQRFVITRHGDLVLVFWLVYMMSALVGLMVNGVVNSAPFTVAFTFLIVLICKFLVDNSQRVFVDGFDQSYYIAVFLMNLLCVSYLLSIISFDVREIFFLRRYLTETATPINSTFNQIYVLIAANMLYLGCCSIGGVLRRCLIVVFVGFFVMFVVFSLSRQNLLAVLILLFLYAMSAFGAKGKALFFVGLAISGLLIVSLGIGDLEALSYVMDRVDKTMNQLDSAEYSRFRQFRDSMIIGLVNPVFGLGMGGFPDFAANQGYSQASQVPEAAINQLASEHGLMLLLIFAVVYMVMWINVAKFFRPPCGIHYRQELGAASKILSAFMMSAAVLFLFNEMHFQASVWVVYLLFYMRLNALRES